MNGVLDLLKKTIVELEDSLLQKKADEEITKIDKQAATSEWMSLKEAAKYANVSPNTFKKFRVRGLKVATIDGVIRVSKTEIDNFFEEHSF